MSIDLVLLIVYFAGMLGIGVWAMRRSTVEWFTPSVLAAPESVPARATARKTLRSSQFCACAFMQGQLSRFANFFAPLNRLPSKQRKVPDNTQHQATGLMERNE